MASKKSKSDINVSNLTEMETVTLEVAVGVIERQENSGGCSDFTSGYLQPFGHWNKYAKQVCS